MVYHHDSNSDKQECLDRIKHIIDECNREIENNTRKEEEIRRINEEREAVIDFLSQIPVCKFPSERFWQVLEHLESFNEEIIDELLSSIRLNYKTFDMDALNKWLKVICEIVRLKGKGVQIGKELWNELIYSFELQGCKIKYVSLIDYFNVFGVHDYSRVLPLLMQPIDEKTSTFLNSIKVENPSFVFYSPLILLNRYRIVKASIPERILTFFVKRQKEIWCLISAQQGRPFGYVTNNLKQIANLVWNRYPDIADLFLYLIRRNGFVSQIADVKSKSGKIPVNHYQRLLECTEKIVQNRDLTYEDLEILFPPKKMRLP